jgi:hypothetical protein
VKTILSDVPFFQGETQRLATAVGHRKGKLHNRPRYATVQASGAPSTKGIQTFLRRSKDATLGFTTRLAINTKLRSIGEMTELSIDTKKKRVRVRLELVGEKEPIDVEIIRYSLKVKGESTHITIEEATSSREWLTVALREFIVGQDLAVPAKAVALLQLLT